MRSLPKFCNYRQKKQLGANQYSKINVCDFFFFFLQILLFQKLLLRFNNKKIIFYHISNFFSSIFQEVQEVVQNHKKSPIVERVGRLLICQFSLDKKKDLGYF